MVSHLGIIGFELQNKIHYRKDWLNDLKLILIGIVYFNCLDQISI
jgi:hypothetical protein